MIKLRHFPVNAAWAFTYRDGTPTRMGSAPMFYTTRDSAVASAKFYGLRVDRRGHVSVNQSRAAA